MTARSRYRSIAVAGVLAGAGVAGLADGLVFRHILAWHGALGAGAEAAAHGRLAAVWDVSSIVGCALLLTFGVARVLRHRIIGPSQALGRRMGAGALLGIGGYLLLESLLFHHVLQLHHVAPGMRGVVWDAVVDAFALSLLIGGGVLLRRPRPEQRAEAWVQQLLDSAVEPIRAAEKQEPAERVLRKTAGGEGR